MISFLGRCVGGFAMHEVLYSRGRLGPPQERRPLVHEHPAPREQIAPEVGPFNPAHSVRQRRLRQLARFPSLCTPVTERRPKAVNRCPLSESPVPEDLRQGHVGEGPARPQRRREDQSAPVVQYPRPLKNDRRRIAQRDAMARTSLHALARDAPFPRLTVNLRPRRAALLPPPARHLPDQPYALSLPSGQRRRSEGPYRENRPALLAEGEGSNNTHKSLMLRHNTYAAFKLCPAL